MLKELKRKSFANGMVYLFETEDGYKIETTDTFLPFYTKDAIGRKQNCLTSEDIGSRKDRWMIGVSVMSGCPIRCKFCATGQLKKWRNLTAEEIVEQIHIIVRGNLQAPWMAKEFKINYTRMGEPFLNIDEVRKAIDIIDKEYSYGDFKPHHYISTIGIKDADFSWIKDNVTLQLSLHSLDETHRNELIPYNRKMTIKELGLVRTDSALKTTLNLTLVDENDFDIGKLKDGFDPKAFFVKLSPINKNVISEANELGDGVIEGINMI
jgi:23S rRNA (adenine2503-C2)-methyltransferase